VRARALGLVAYEPTWRAMQAYSAARGADAEDQLWLVQHPRVFTLGIAGRREHVLAPRDIPVVATDRGGQVTYHGPGQAVVYTLLDLRRLGIGARELVRRLEEGAIAMLGDYGVAGVRRKGMPGVYVGEAKIAAIGLRIARGCSFHGLAFNVAMDLEPFERINPCGYKGLAVTQLVDLGGPSQLADVETVLADEFCRQFGFVAAPAAPLIPELPARAAV